MTVLFSQSLLGQIHEGVGDPKLKENERGKEKAEQAKESKRHDGVKTAALRNSVCVCVYAHVCVLVSSF